MSATAIVMLQNEFKAAVNCKDNWNENGINWDYVDADCFHVYENLRRACGLFRA